MRLLDNKPRLSDAIKELTDEKWSHYKGGDPSTIGWDNPENAPSIEALNSKLSELVAEWETKKYQRDRAVAYDPITEQLDQIYHDINGWKAKVKAVKDKYPKPT